jgi:uncharacterized protein (TIGR00255 family)
VLLSMTGFGEGRSESDSIAVVAEVRTINGRHLKTNYRCSDGYSQLEPQIEAVLRESVRRGSVQVNLKVNRHAVADDFHVNLDVLEGYRRQLGKLASEVRVESLLMLPGVVQMPDAAGADVECDWPAVSAALNAAIERLTAMRAKEGAALAADLANQCGVIATELVGVAERAPEVVINYRDKLHERLTRALEKFSSSLDPGDLVREVALFADRCDISEEIVRLRSHIEQFLAAIALPESSGRKLEFIAQEMGREVNTIGSKANDTEISRRVVEMKTALERIREQVQNVE